MSEATPTSPQSSTPTAKPTAAADTKPLRPPRPPNPIYKYLGLGANFRPRLPSRNWLIFLSLTSTLTGFIIYDKRETRRAQRKWCKLVEHIGKEPLSNPNAMPRRLTVYLEAPPADGLRVAQEHFKSYVKPVLVASGLDWEFVQGRNEGDVRAEVAERLREWRRPEGERKDWDSPVLKARRSQGIQDYDGPGGDIVVGRHTWKEYVRGLHEGWLGPLEEPPKLVKEEVVKEPPGEKAVEKEEKVEEPHPKPPPYISTKDYVSTPLPSNLPETLDPSTPMPFPHVLGFSSTHTRFYRFLNRRHLADQICRQTAAIILSVSRPYHTSVSSPSTLDSPANSPTAQQDEQAQVQAEQQTALVEEEKEWHKSTRVRKEDEGERVWLDPMVLDPRIAGRMRKAELSQEEEERAKGIVVPETEVEGWVKGGLRSLGSRTWQALGFGGEKKRDAVAVIDEGDDEE